MNQTNPRSVLITGANKGIGFEVARQLAGRGFRVFVGARDRARGDEAAAGIRQQGGSVEVVEIDVADSDSVRAAASAVARHAPRLDVLINNAGIYPDQGLSILTIDRERLTATFQTNTFGPVAVTQAFLPLLEKGHHARIINVSSGLGALDGQSPDVPSYCLSKLALNGVTLMLSKALGPRGIAVNSVCPGWVRTEMGGANADRSVEEGAAGIVWLAAEAPQELTGKFLRDGKEIPW